MSTLKERFEAGEYDAVVEGLREIESGRLLEAPELLLKGRAIQLGSNGALLPEAETAFLEALRRDPENVEAMLQLGWYYDVVEDNPARALPYFEKVRELLHRWTERVDEGLAHCRDELASGDY